MTTDTALLSLVEADIRAARFVIASTAEPGDGAFSRWARAVGDTAPDVASAIVQRDWSFEHVATDAEHHELLAGIERWQPRVPSHADVTRALAAMEAKAIWSLDIFESQSSYPANLRDLGDHAPLVLFGIGDSSVLDAEHKVAMVGSRAATGYGEHVAMSIASELADRGEVIVSGGAYGIDGMAHRAAIAAGGQTIAFLAGGVDRFSPMGHESLLQTITQHGAVVSELPPGSAPTKWRFLQRNRLIAALSHGTVVVEAGVRSGSLNTASHSLALGRPTMAVPGPVTSPASAGTARLIREYGATLVTSATDIAETLSDR